MPPKKNVNSAQTEKKVQKPRKGRVVKEKPKSKTPTIITISIPNHRIALDTPAPDLPEWNVRHLGIQSKIDLANEVARSQLVKPETIEIPVVEPVAKGNKGRRKTVVLKFFDDTTKKETPEPAAPDPPRKVVNKKTPPKSKAKGKPVSKKRAADTTVPKPAKRPKLTPKVNKPATVKSKPNLKCSDTIPVTRVLRRKSTVGKQAENSLANGNLSPSILDTLLTPKTEIDADTPDVKPKEDVASSCNKQVETKTKSSTATRVPGPINSRNTSIASNSSLSWTKDISSTSTTTCVTVSSNDFVRFNKRIPVIRLRNVESSLLKRKNDAAIEDSSSSESDSDSESESENINDLVDVKSINLSVSSDPNSARDGKNKQYDHDKIVEKLDSTLKKIDLEIINWFSFKPEEVTADLVRLKDKMFDILNSEFGIINHCRHLKQFLDPRYADKSKLGDNAPHLETNTNKEVEFAEPSTVNIHPKVIEDKDVPAEPSVNDKEDKCLTETSHDKCNVANDKFKYVSIDNYDDDDALSLYAESITCMDTSRVNSSIASNSTKVHNNEEYVPEPVTNISPEKYVYHPTKISEDIQTFKSTMVCEKQNADSTSISKEADKNDGRVYASSQDRFNQNATVDKVETLRPPPSLLSLQFKSEPFKSVIFRGVCFFNLLNSCKKQLSGYACQFPHVIPLSEEISDRLSKISEALFIQEYMSMRNRPELRRMYGLCFVAECIKRDLTTILIEMALDFILKAKPRSQEDMEMKLNVSEMTLLYLNKVDLKECEGILKFEFVKGTMLCDYFMRTLAVTFNFSRFRPVFVNLTSFMVRVGRTFHLEVVGQILERVCILAYDRALATAVLAMMRCTSPKIFKNSMIRMFEKQILVDWEVNQEYLSVKRGAELRLEWSSNSSAVSSPRLAHSEAQRSEGEERTPPAPSPDTTNLDNMNKKVEEPVITRTIDLNRAQRPKQFNVPDLNRAQRPKQFNVPDLNRAQRPEQFNATDMNRGQRTEQFNAPDLNRGQRPEQFNAPDLNQGQRPEQFNAPDLNRGQRPEEYSAPDLNRGQRPEQFNVPDLNRGQRPEQFNTPNLNRAQQFNVPPSFSPRPQANENQKIIRQIQDWRINNISPRQRMPVRHQRPMFPPTRPYRPMRAMPHKRPPQRLVTYSGSHVNYMPRPPGPYY